MRYLSISMIILSNITDEAGIGPSLVYWCLTFGTVLAVRRFRLLLGVQVVSHGACCGSIAALWAVESHRADIACDVICWVANRCSTDAVKSCEME